MHTAPTGVGSVNYARAQTFGTLQGFGRLSAIVTINVAFCTIVYLRLPDRVGESVVDGEADGTEVGKR